MCTNIFFDVRMMVCVILIGKSDYLRLVWVHWQAVNQCSKLVKKSSGPPGSPTLKSWGHWQAVNEKKNTQTHALSLCSTPGSTLFSPTHKKLGQVMTSQ